MNKKIIITTGGTGGHIFPAFSIASRLKKEFDVLIIGDENLSKFVNQIEVEYKIVPTAKTKSIGSIFNIFKGIIKSILILKKEKPDLVMGFGSYATFPVLVASKILKIPVVLHEQNTCMGKVNRWFQNYAKVIFSSFPEIYGVNIDNSDKIEYVGNPIRSNIKELSNFEYKYPNFEKGEKFNIFIIAGSGGASFFGNEFLNFTNYVNRDFIKHVHINQQVKNEDLIKTKNFYAEKNISANVKTFFEDMDTIYKQTNLVICRSGATTIAELSTIGLPTIFFPSPFVANDHQYKNSKAMGKQNACVIFKQNEYNAESFGKFLNDLIFDKERLNNFSKNIKKFSMKDADTNIENIIKEIL